MVFAMAPPKVCLEHACQIQQQMSHDSFYHGQVTLNGDWAETMFYNMLSGKLPIRTPRIFFADMNRKTTPLNGNAFKEKLSHVATSRPITFSSKNWVAVKELKLGTIINGCTYIYI